MTSNPIWYPSADLIAQAGHFLLGFVFVIFPFAFFPNWKYGALYCAAAALIYMVIKEFIFDIFVEKATLTAGLRDLGFLVAGLLFAFAFYGIIVAFRFYLPLYRN